MSSSDLFPDEMVNNEVLYALITLVAAELGISPEKMSKIYMRALLGVQSMKRRQENAEPPKFPEEEL